MDAKKQTSLRYAVKWTYEHFIQKTTSSRNFDKRYKNYLFAKNIADKTFWEHRVNGILISRVSAVVIDLKNKSRAGGQIDLFNEQTGLAMPAQLTCDEQSINDSKKTNLRQNRTGRPRRNSGAG